MLANKLNANHIHFHNQKQKVSFATQLFSRSTAIALKYMREVLKHPKFLGSEATEEFLLCINDVFDLLNSRGWNKQCLKSSIGNHNKNIAYGVFDKADALISGLKMKNGKLLVNCGKRIGFVGFLLNIIAVKKIYDLLVETGEMKMLSTWYFNQDSLENFFACIRARFGANNNPTAEQFKNMYKRLLLGITGNISLTPHANVIVNAECELPTLARTTKEKMNLLVPSMEEEEGEVDDLYICKFDRDVAEYIGGYVIRRLERESKCSTCTEKLRANDKPSVSSLISVKDKGGLIYLNEDICKVFIIAEKQMSNVLTVKNALEDNFFLERNSAKIRKSCMELIPNLNSKFDEHFSTCLKKMIDIYITIRCKYFCKDTNVELKKNQTRQKLNRLVLFRHL